MSASSVSFAWADAAAVHAWSVVEITSGKLYEKDGKPTPGGLRDARLGTSRRGRCVTCGEGWEKCPGHFGHLELAEPVYHPGLLQRTIRLLKRICKHCHVGHIKPKRKCVACGEAMWTPVKGDKHGIVNLLASEALEWMGVDEARGIIRTFPIPPRRSDHPPWRMATRSAGKILSLSSC